MNTGGVALVTGASGGIGGAVARELAARGWRLALTGRRAGALADTAAACGPMAGDEPLVLAADLTQAAEVEALSGALDARWARLDLLVHAAGTARFAPLVETSDTLWSEALSSNLTSAFLVTQAVLPLLRRGRDPMALYVASVAARKGFAGFAAYGAAKTGLAGFAAALREELRADGARTDIRGGVRVGIILPGATDTALWDAQPGSWDRARMMPPEAVARAVADAAGAPAAAAVEEILLRPAGGDL